MDESDLPKRQRVLQRGGSRIRRDRESWQLTARDCRKLIDASRAAWFARMPMNRFITISWGLGGIDARHSVTQTGRFVRLAREWVQARGHPMPWAWVQEAGPRLGAHCHMLLHVPHEYEPLFRTMPLRWAKSLAAGRYVAGMIESQRLPAAHSSNAGLYEAQLMGKLHYMLKCAPAAMENELNMMPWRRKPWGQSCLVHGKRAGVWQGWQTWLTGGDQFS
ncbi:MAG: hypothetical protein WCY11_06140 [Novosphingobium sp.]